MDIYVNFADLSARIQSLIEEKDRYLYNNGLSSRTHKFKVFTNSGDYINYRQTNYLDGQDAAFYRETHPEASASEDAINGSLEAQNRLVLVNIRNNGGMQDSSTPVQTYLQMVTILFSAPEEFRSDMEVLFFSLAIDLKSKLTTIGSSTPIQFLTDEQPELGEKQQLGIDFFEGSLDTSVVAYINTKISNNYHLKIANQEIPFSKIDMGRGYETSPSLKKQTEVKYFQNTSTFSVTITALYSSQADTDITNILFSDMTNNTNFNAMYNVALYEGDSASPKWSANMFASDIQFHWVYGSIVAWSATFMPAIAV